MNINFDRRVDRRGTDSYKWDDNERLFGRRDLLPFWVADMDFAPDCVTDGDNAHEAALASDEAQG